MNSKFMTISEACQRYHFGRTTFYEIKKKFGQAKDFPATFKVGKSTLLRISEWDEFIERNFEK